MKDKSYSTKNNNLSPKLIGIFLSLLISACSDTEDQFITIELAAEDEANQIIVDQLRQLSGVSSVQTAQTQIMVQNGFNSNGRPPADIEANPGRKPEQVIAWAGITEGMSVIDIGASGGYYSENLAWAVGLDGWVIAQNTPGDLDRFEGRNRITLDARLANARLPQIETAEIAFADLSEEFDELNAATFVNILHDIYNYRGEAVAVAALQSIHDTLLPGGFLILIDHVGKSNKDNTDLHRIDPAIAQSLLNQAGFVIVEQSDILRTSNDDPDVSVFDSSVRGNTHRFIFKAVKPAG